MEPNQYINSIFNTINRGKQGLNVGIPMGFKRLSDHVSNIQQSRYDLISGGTGTGKTALVDSAYVMYPYDYVMNPTNNCIHDLEIVYYSLEIDPEQKIAKLMANKLWRDHGIATSVSEIFSKGNNRITQQVENAINNVREYFEIFQTKVKFRSSCNPNFLYKDLMDHAEARGRIVRGPSYTPGELGPVIEFVPDNPNLITLVIIDHIGLMTPNPQDKGSLKAAIDRASKTLIHFRNIFKYSPVVVSQFNRAIENHDRMKGSNEPKLSDLKDSGGPSEDANTVIGLYYPYRYGKTEHNGYNIEILNRYYRSLHLLKNRDGQDNLVLGLLFMGQNGYFRELPKVSDIAMGQVSYEQIMGSIGQEVEGNIGIDLNN